MHHNLLLNVCPSFFSNLSQRLSFGAASRSAAGVTTPRGLYDGHTNVPFTGTQQNGAEYHAQHHSQHPSKAVTDAESGTFATANYTAAVNSGGHTSLQDMNAPSYSQHSNMPHHSVPSWQHVPAVHDDSVVPSIVHSTSLPSARHDPVEHDGTVLVHSSPNAVGLVALPGRTLAGLDASAMVTGIILPERVAGSRQTNVIVTQDGDVLAPESAGSAMLAALADPAVVSAHPIDDDYDDDDDGDDVRGGQMRDQNIQTGGRNVQ